MSLLTSLFYGNEIGRVSFGSVSSAHGGGSYAVTINGRMVNTHIAVGVTNRIGIGSTVMVGRNSSGRRYIVGVTPTTKSSAQVTVAIDV